jgi:tight adherence protein C
MSIGLLSGLGVGLGVWLALTRLVALGPPTLVDRLALQLRRDRVDGPLLDGTVSSTVEGLVRPYGARAAERLERLVGGGESVRRRLRRAGSPLDLQEFRIQQVLWATMFVVGAAALSLAMIAAGSARSPGLLIVFVAGMAIAGVIARDQMLTREIRLREARILAELPTVADLLAVSVAAGESPAAALERTARVARGDLGHELGLALNDVRAGAGLVAALDAMSRRLTVPAVTRFVDGITVAVERGTPLADVLRAQAADAREVRKRVLMEIGGRKEILMLIPVVFLVLPITILFALYPGLAQFNVIAP